MVSPRQRERSRRTVRSMRLKGQGRVLCTSRTRRLDALQHAQVHLSLSSRRWPADHVWVRMESGQTSRKRMCYGISSCEDAGRQRAVFDVNGSTVSSGLIMILLCVDGMNLILILEIRLASVGAQSHRTWALPSRYRRCTDADVFPRPYAECEAPDGSMFRSAKTARSKPR